jgi:hypothetical protein
LKIISLENPLHLEEPTNKIVRVEKYKVALIEGENVHEVLEVGVFGLQWENFEGNYESERQTDG